MAVDYLSMLLCVSLGFRKDYTHVCTINTCEEAAFDTDNMDTIPRRPVKSIKKTPPADGEQSRKSKVKLKKERI